MPEGKLSITGSLQLLGLQRPRIVGKSQADIDLKLKEWKEGPLRKAYRASALLVHPDRNPGDEGAAERFKEIQAAYDHLQELRVQFRPKSAVESPPPAENLEAILLRRKVVPSTIAAMKESGEWDKFLRMDPTSKAFMDEVNMLLTRQRLGLFGRFSGWG